MALRLSLLNEKQLPDGGPVSYTLDRQRRIEIGRDGFLDWVLPDPSRVLSGRHCEIEARDDAYWLTDKSRNGTFLNGSAQRMQSPYRLRDGDRLSIGPYIVVVSLDEVAVAPRRSALPRAIGLGEVAPGRPDVVAPPIEPARLRPDLLSPADYDPSGWHADLPSLVWSPASNGDDEPGQSDSDWLPVAMPPKREPARPSKPDIVATPTDPSGGQAVSLEPDPGPSSWLPVSPDAPVPVVVPPPAPVPSEPVGVAPAPIPPDPSPAVRAGPGPTADTILHRFSQGAGIPSTVFDGQDPGAVAERLGALVRVMAMQVKQLLDARQSAKRMVRSADHTSIAAFDNNPLKFLPTTEDALAVMFGPKHRAYLDAEQAFTEALNDLAAHQLRTFSAMQRAVQMLQQDLGPAAIESAVPVDTGLAALIQSRKSALWDTYVARWAGRAKRNDGILGAFMLDFADCYDDPQKGVDVAEVPQRQRARP